MQLNEIYLELKELDVCSSGHQFSTNYLGMHKSYYGMLLASNKEPSTTALVNLRESILICTNDLNHLTRNKLNNITTKISSEISKRGRNSLQIFNA